MFVKLGEFIDKRHLGKSMRSQNLLVNLFFFPLKLTSFSLESNFGIL